MAECRGRILVVDDDEGLRTLLVRYLSDNGYEAAGVGDGTAMKRHLATHPVDLLLLGIGAEPETTLAEAAGLEVDDGVRVDAFLQSSDPAIMAIGDCVRFPEPGQSRGRRLESVQNANDQARCAAAGLLGRPVPYQPMPWFWSEQGGMRLQMAGLLPADASQYLRPGSQAGSFTLLHYAGDRLACAESVNAPMDHLALRKLMEAGRHPAPERASDPSVPLKSLA